MAFGGGSASGGRNRANGRRETSLQLQNMAVTAELYRRLLPSDLQTRNRLQSDGPATSTVDLSEEEKRTVEAAAEKMERVIARTPRLAVAASVREFTAGGWEVTADNIEEEFMEVERRTFSDGVHWGRVIAFLAFSVSFAAYVASRGISGGTESVFAWTTRVLDSSLSDFMQRERGWTGFIAYADTLIRAQDTQRQVGHQQSPQQAAGLWDHLATYGAGIGAIGFGALLALGVRQAFS